MSCSEFTTFAYWAERPVAAKIADAESRGRVVVTGTIVESGPTEMQGVTSARFVLDDATSQLDLIFLGRAKVAGLSIRTCCTGEGTARIDHDRLVVWNPLYRIEPAEPTLCHCESSERE
jgi:hypothetical protein